IAYTIEAALKSKLVTRVILSTEDPEIANIAQKYGAEVPFLRPVHLATDTSNAIDTYRYTCKRLEQQENLDITEFMILQPTSPFRTSDHIDQAIALFRDKKADSVISYCQENH